MRRRLYALGGLAAVAVAVALLVTGGRATSQPAARADEAWVRVKQRDFRISAPERVASGDLRLSVRNQGPDSHELIVVRKRTSRLPFRTDGTTVDEEALEPATVGVLEAGDPGSVRDLRVHLAPGRYELFCNMSGHYLGGMEADLVVQ
jgi:uncharacterized cupredoxin-like copper-binding protein